jgi:hypothetical protein
MSRTDRRCLVVFKAVLLLLVLAIFQEANAQGGPPMLTDDPGIPGNGMWEINLLSSMERTRHGWLLETPNVDLNYGLGNHIQLKFEAPWVIKKESGERMIGGPGNSMAGIKWRFLDEERNGFDLSVYPQLEFNNPTHSMARGLVDEGRNLFLPVEASRKVGPVRINGEIGYRIVQHRTDELAYGLLFARQTSRRLELMAEVHGSVLRTMRENELTVNAGSRIRLSKHSVLLVSAGRTIHEIHGQAPHYTATIGIQFNFSHPVLQAATFK